MKIFRLVTLPLELVLCLGFLILFFIFAPLNELKNMTSEEITNKIVEMFEGELKKVDTLFNFLAIIIWILIIYKIYERI